jgi:CRP-like cAMP-binding protein
MNIGSLKKAELLYAEGDHSDEIYFIESGGMEVVKAVGGDGAVLRLAKLAKGAMVGELAFYTGDPRSASIAATQGSAGTVAGNHAGVRCALTIR